MEKKEHLSMYGVGPFYGISILLITAIMIVLSCMGILPGKIEVPFLIVLFVVFGIFVAIFGFMIWKKASLGAESIDGYIKSNALCKTGVYGIVRNPCYSGIMLICTGALLIAHNYLLMVLPFIYWLAMTIMLICSEERWLNKMYGEEYKIYRGRVNRCIPWFPKKTKKRIFANVIVLLILVLLILPFGVSVFVYEQFFGIRYETSGWQKYSIEDFEGLSRTEYDFTSDQGQKIAGYLYYVENVDYRGVVVFGHGFGGGGHNSYMECADYFANHGYYVYAFDATGNDESEGTSVKGFPQQVIDMDYAISYVETLPETKDLPVMLFGHSWGGYTVTNVIKYHPEVKAVVSLAGFNKSSDLLEAQGKEMVGDYISLLMPYIKAYEWMKFGSYATSTAMDAFADTDTAVMVYHSKIDTMVSREYGYDIWYDEYADSDRFRFILRDDIDGNGHNLLYYNQKAIDYFLALNETMEPLYEDWKDGLNYDYEAAENEERYEKDYIRFMRSNIDWYMWCHCIDEKMFSDMVEFYDSQLDKET